MLNFVLFLLCSWILRFSDYPHFCFMLFLNVSAFLRNKLPSSAHRDWWAFLICGCKIMPRIHNRQIIIVNLCMYIIFLWHVSRKPTCNHKFSEKTMKIQILSYFVILFCRKMKKNHNFQAYLTISVTLAVPFMVIRSFYMTRNQTRWRSVLRANIERRFIEFGSEDERSYSDA